MKSSLVGACVLSLASALSVRSENDSSLSVPISDLTTIQYNTIVAGVAYGYIQKEGCTEIITCIADGKAEALLAYDAFTHIETGIPSEVIIGFDELAQVMTALPATLTTCKNI